MDEELKKMYLLLKEEHEITKQELHECKRNLNIMQSTELDYKNEINMLQSQEIKQKQKYQEIIRQLEQTHNDERTKYYEEKQTLEDHITKMEEKCDKLKSDFAFNANTTHFQGDTSNLIEEILAEPQEYYENQELKLKLQELVDTNKVLEEKVQGYAKELENLKESYEYIRSELKEANSNNTYLIDENAMYKKELELLKSQPLDKDSKGNSLFAEVNDRRVYLQDQVNKMKSSYMAMTQEKMQLQNTVHHLKLENLKILEKWNADIYEFDNDKDEIQQDLRSRIKELEKLNEQYAKELAKKPWIVSKISFEEIQFFEAMLNDKKTEIKSLKEDLINKTLANLSFAEELAQVKNEKRKWRLQAMSKQHQLELIQSKEEIYNSDIKEEDIGTEDIDQNSVSKRESKHTSTSKERLCDVKEKQLEFGNSDGQLDEILNVNVDNYLKRMKDLDNSKVSDASVKPRDTSMVTKERKPRDASMVTKEKKVNFTNDTVSPERSARRNFMVVSRPPIEL